MAERVVERDEPVMDEQSEELRRAMDRAERAEAELAKLKGQHAAPAKAAHEAGHTRHKDDGRTTPSPAHREEAGEKESAHEIAEHLAPRGTSSTAEPDRTGRHMVQPGSMDRSKADAAQSPEGHAVGEPEARGVEALRDDAMMAHLLDALENGEDIGHYGRLTFAMIARHFLEDDEVIAELTKDEDFTEEEARQMLMQVEGRDYSPPRRERILEWQAEQHFAIIPDTHDPDCGNVYKSLRFPKQTYNHIGHYQQEKAES